MLPSQQSVSFWQTQLLCSSVFDSFPVSQPVQPLFYVSILFYASLITDLFSLPIALSIGLLLTYSPCLHFTFPSHHQLSSPLSDTPLQIPVGKIDLSEVGGHLSYLRKPYQLLANPKTGYPWVKTHTISYQLDSMAGGREMYLGTLKQFHACLSLLRCCHSI